MYIKSLTKAVLLLLTITILACSGKYSNPKNFVGNDEDLVQDGERVIFWGDSITDNGAYFRTIENYYRGRYPHYDLDFANFGWAGDTAKTSVMRVKRDLTLFKPTLVFIKLGMNDGGYDVYDEERKNTYIDNMRKLVEIIRSKTKARVVFITTIPYEKESQPNRKLQNGEPFGDAYVDTLRKFSDSLINLAAELNVKVIDLNRSYYEAISKYKEENRMLFSGDGIHPGLSGHALMAFLILEGMNADGRFLKMEVDMKSGEVSSENMTAKAKQEGESVIIKRQPQAFPFRIHGEEGVEFDTSNWFKKNNANILKVKSLDSPYCVLKTTDRPIAVFSKEELEEGVNLRGLGLPEEEVASFIAQLVDEKQNSRYHRWRRVLATWSSEKEKDPRTSSRFSDDTYQSVYDKMNADNIVKYFNDGNLGIRSYELILVPSDKKTLFPEAPFEVQSPFPTADEVQILFVIDTTKWKNIVSDKTDNPLSFTPPLKIKSGFTHWQLVELYDNGKNGDAIAGDGKWSCAINISRNKRDGSIASYTFAFDDGSKERGGYESLVMEIVKNGLGQVPGISGQKHPYVTADKHKIFEITPKHFDKAVEMGFIKVK